MHLFYREGDSLLPKWKYVILGIQLKIYKPKDNMKHTNRIFILLLTLVFLASCSTPAIPTTSPTATQPAPTSTVNKPQEAPPANTEISPMSQTQFANVLSVSVSGGPGAYQFAIQIASPDTGCEQYADWWEVISEDGELLYRRILLHSHVGEQPFTRSGGAVDIAPNTVVYVRAHMNTVGYGGAVMRGSVQDGFETIDVEAGFGADLERVPPQPEDCAF
jgi:hypothetical protein